MRKLECLLCGAYFHWVRVSGARSERMSGKHTRYLEIKTCALRAGGRMEGQAVTGVGVGRLS